MTDEKSTLMGISPDAVVLDMLEKCVRNVSGR